MSLIPGNMPLVMIGILSATGAKGAGATREEIAARPHYFQDTPFPVQDPNPGLFKTLASVSFSDMFLLSAFSTSGFALGNVAGMRPASLRVPTVAMAGSLGVTAGLFVAFQRSSGRLLGLVDPKGW